MASALTLCTENTDPINASHITIVKPKDQESDSYIAFRNAYRNTRPSIALKIPDDVSFESIVRNVVRMDSSEEIESSVTFSNCTTEDKAKRLRPGIIRAEPGALFIQRIAAREAEGYLNIKVQYDERRKLYAIECIQNQKND